MYTEKDLDILIIKTIDECDLANICHFAKTKAGKDRILNRVKQHILIRGIQNVDTAIGLVDTELSEPYIETK